MYLQNSEYKMISNLGLSSDHVVLKAQHSETQNVYAIKIEKKPGIGQVETEVQILQQLFGIEGIPKLIQYGKTKDFKNYLIIPLLNCSLQDLGKTSLLSQNSILAIGLTVIRTIKQVHNKGILHLDIKPQNIMISQRQIIDSVEQILIPGNVQLIDFGLSQNLGNQKFLKETFIGSIRFASRQSHKKEQLGYKDDLESLLYVLAYLRKKKLPWQQTQQKAFQLMDIRRIGIIKDQVYETSMLSQQFPPQFYQFQLYIDSLTPSQMPDYNYIEELFKQMLQLNQPSITPSFPKPTPCFSKYKELEDQEYIKLSESVSSLDGDARAIIISDLIKAYTTIGIKSLKDIHF
ncbi:unnamed protein product [Paramecium octaurelia]|uniref:Casein kinase I n=1 Tax=Paramecium octaurelia TaxID=43137 RepID=A0A8S1SVN3_PAROT|nr:unnamed protein product [Paramecium octaurelia]